MTVPNNSVTSVRGPVDAHDVSAEVAEDPARIWPGDRLRQIEHAPGRQRQLGAGGARVRRDAEVCWDDHLLAPGAPSLIGLHRRTSAGPGLGPATPVPPRRFPQDLVPGHTGAAASAATVNSRWPSCSRVSLSRRADPWVIRRRAAGHVQVQCGSAVRSAPGRSSAYCRVKPYGGGAERHRPAPSGHWPGPLPGSPERGVLHPRRADQGTVRRRVCRASSHHVQQHRLQARGRAGGTEIQRRPDERLAEGEVLRLGPHPDAVGRDLAQAAQMRRRRSDVRRRGRVNPGQQYGLAAARLPWLSHLL